MDRKPFPWVVFIIFVLVITLPYLIAWMYSDANVSFNGFLLNPIDGYSYLAKVEQGRSGLWLFQLPFTSEPNSGAPIFLYYLFLGHLARLLGIKSLAIIHIARITNAILLFIVLWRACIFFIGKAEKWVVAILTLGGGMGWLILLWVNTPTDFWVAEGYPFLASYTNPHFPLAMALIVSTIIIWKSNTQKFGFLFSFFSGAFLSTIQPFGVVIVVMTLGLDWILCFIKQKKISGTGYPKLLSFIVGGLPYSIYLLTLINGDPVLAEWNRQNVTPSPGILDLLLSFSPGLLIIIAGAIYVIRKKIVLNSILVIWVIVTIGLSFIPFNLQRRFLLSGYIPVTLLAISIIDIFLDGSLFIGRLLRKAYLPAVLITPLFILLIASIGIYTKNPLIYIYSHQDVTDGADWLIHHAPKPSTVLSDAKTGLYLPALANVRVVYGHPFETPHADEKKMAVDRCFSDGDTVVCDQVIHDDDVDYLWLNLENSEKLPKYLEKYRLVFNSHTVSIYEID